MKRVRRTVAAVLAVVLSASVAAAEMDRDVAVLIGVVSVPREVTLNVDESAANVDGGLLQLAAVAGIQRSASDPHDSDFTSTTLSVVNAFGQDPARLRVLATFLDEAGEPASGFELPNSCAGSNHDSTFWSSRLGDLRLRVAPPIGSQTGSSLFDGSGITRSVQDFGQTWTCVPAVSFLSNIPAQTSLEDVPVRITLWGKTTIASEEPTTYTLRLTYLLDDFPST